MKWTPIVTATLTAVAMTGLLLLKEQLNFTLYILIVLAPAVLSAVFVHQRAKGQAPSNKLSLILLNTLAYTVVFGIGSVMFANAGGYNLISLNSFSTMPDGLALGQVEGFSLSELLLPALSAFVLFFLALRAKVNRHEFEG